MNNNKIAETFTLFTLNEVNRMERSFIILIDYEMNIKSGDYANAYFLLRSYTKKKDRSFPLKPLDVETVLKLQRRNQQVENIAKDALLKSF